MELFRKRKNSRGCTRERVSAGLIRTFGAVTFSAADVKSQEEQVTPSLPETENSSRGGRQAAIPDVYNVLPSNRPRLRSPARM